MLRRLATLSCVWITALTSSSVVLSAPKERPAYEDLLKNALKSVKDAQHEKLRATLANLTEQVKSDVEPTKRLQAAVLLAAHYWDTNYRLSRYYLGVAEALKDPTIADLQAYNIEIEHMKIRFRHAALLDGETKKKSKSSLNSSLSSLFAYPSSKCCSIPIKPSPKTRISADL